MALADEVRVDAGVAIGMFRQSLGVDNISMITGDSESVALKVCWTVCVCGVD